MQNAALNIRRAAMDLLARREHSQFELKQKLSQRFENQELIEEAINQLALDNLQSDSRFAEQYIRMRAGKAYGFLKIQQELQQKGIHSDVANAAFIENAIDWQAVLYQLYIKKYGEKPPADAKEQARCSRFLLSHGFAFDELRHLWRQLKTLN